MAPHLADERALDIDVAASINLCVSHTLFACVVANDTAIPPPEFVHRDRQQHSKRIATPARRYLRAFLSRYDTPPGPDRAYISVFHLPELLAATRLGTQGGTTTVFKSWEGRR